MHTLTAVRSTPTGFDSTQPLREEDLAVVRLCFEAVMKPEKLRLDDAQCLGKSTESGTP
jgi:hypothetical protein